LTGAVFSEKINQYFTFDEKVKGGNAEAAAPRCVVTARESCAVMSGLYHSIVLQEPQMARSGKDVFINGRLSLGGTDHGVC
jgi:hypothetical protein